MMTSLKLLSIFLIVNTPILLLASLTQKNYTLSADNLTSLLRKKNYKEIYDLGPKGYNKLSEMMLSSGESMEIRWEAALAIGQLAKKEAIPELMKGLNSKAWFVRSASLLALLKVDRKVAVRESKRIMQEDKALLVRSTALQVYAEAGQVDKSFLWEQLNNPINYRGSIGLPIRHSLYRVLSKAVTKKDYKQMIGLIKDNDAQLRKMVIETLRSNNNIVNKPKGNSYAQWNSWLRSTNL